MEVEIEMNKIIETIQKEKAKNVLLQFPEGLKSKALIIAKQIEKSTGCNVFVWLNSCYGSCDVPLVGKLESKIDLIISFGHSLWPFSHKVKAIEL